AAKIAGVREVCLDDIVARFSAGMMSEAELPDKLKEWRDTPGHHYFTTGHEQETEAVAAFGPARTLKAQADYCRKYGEAKAREVAAEFGTTLGGRPGKVPEHYAKPKQEAAKLPGGESNPWSADGWNVTKQGQLIKVMGAAKAQ